jgi:hypothetical protein
MGGPLESLRESSKALLEVADRELQRLSHITSRSLKFYRQRTAPSLTPLTEIIESVLFFHETEIKLRSIDLQRRYRDAAPVLCFTGEMQQVLTNLISNALEAVPDRGGMCVRVQPATDPGGRSGVAVTVADGGTGMDRYTIGRLPSSPPRANQEPGLASGCQRGFWTSITAPSVSAAVRVKEPRFACSCPWTRLSTRAVSLPIITSEARILHSCTAGPRGGYAVSLGILPAGC